MLIDSWIKSARVSLDELEREIEYVRNERTELSVQVNDLEKEVKRLREGIRSILSDYDITELIRDVPEDEWNFEQQALVRMKEMIE